LELDKLAKRAAKKFEYKRYLYPELEADQSKIFKAIVGPRGVGKTVLLQQLCSNTQNSFYMSADTVEAELDLFDLVKMLQQHYGFQAIFIDEIHFNKKYQKALKNIYDFLDVRIIFTSSMAVSLVNSAFDLSLRVMLFEFHLFSFWEFLSLKGEKINPLSLKDLVEGHIPTIFNRYG